MCIKQLSCAAPAEQSGLAAMQSAALVLTQHATSLAGLSRQHGARRAEEDARAAMHRQYKAQGQARLEELIRDARAGKKAKQHGKERRLGSDPFDFLPQGVTPQDFMFGDGPTRG